MKERIYRRAKIKVRGGDLFSPTPKGQPQRVEVQNWDARKDTIQSLPEQVEANEKPYQAINGASQQKIESWTIADNITLLPPYNK